ncbi:MAG: hypothetical protein Q7R96_05675 [Nanoarchaeota archaeon]|nr:hypothetical protein [Nanoarchaeota archaeon]
MTVMNAGEQFKFNVYETVKRKGPVVPAQISKDVGRDTFFVGAILSDLLREKKVLFSKAKIGGSSVYYVAGQESKLDILFNYLPMKEKEAFTLLKKYQFVRDTELEPSIRVALRNLKDFAIPLNVNAAGTQELFWKWHLLSDADAEKLLYERYLPQQPEAPQQLPETTLQPLQKTPEHPVPLPLTTEPQKKKTKPGGPDLFEQQLAVYFTNKNITPLNHAVIKKNKTHDYTIQLPTPVGTVLAYAYADNKKKVNDEDLTHAYNQASMRKLPLLYITPGNLSKKTQQFKEQHLPGITIITLQ